MATSTVPASTCWLSLTGTSTTTPPTRAATGVTCASTCASSVDSRPAVAHSQTPVPISTISTTPIAIRIRVFTLRSPSGSPPRPSRRRAGLLQSEIPFDFVFGDAQRSREHRFCHEEAVARADELLAGGGDGFLRLYDFDVTGDARLEPVARLRQLQGRELARLGG